jgi:hypothetical protein
MPRELDAGELDEFWTLTADELKRAGGKRDANALAFALLFKFFVARGRFPHGRAELPDEAVKFVAGQVRVPASDLESYDWSGRTVERHRAEIRELLGFRECSVADYTAAADWLVEQVTQVERVPEQVRVELAQLVEAASPGAAGHCTAEPDRPVRAGPRRKAPRGPHLRRSERADSHLSARDSVRRIRI